MCANDLRAAVIQSQRIRPTGIPPLSLALGLRSNAQNRGGALCVSKSTALVQCAGANRTRCSRLGELINAGKFESSSNRPKKIGFSGFTSRESSHLPDAVRQRRL